MDTAVEVAGFAVNAGIAGLRVVGIPDKKDAKASGAYADSGIVQKAARAMKDK